MEKIAKQPGENVTLATGEITPANGSTGLPTHAGGQPTTVSTAALQTGGVEPGHFIEPDIDDELFKFKGDDTPLMNIMLKAKKVKVNSPEVLHYMIDEERSAVVTNSALTIGNNTTQYATLKLAPEDVSLIKEQDTLIAVGVDGYKANGSTKTPGKPLMMYVTGADPSTGAPIVRALNGVKASPEAEISCMVTIPSGTTLRILSNALYETQMEVEPDNLAPVAETVYLQKRGMNQIVSEYYESQRKHMPFAKAVIAEAAIKRFKCKGNRTLWASVKGKFKVKADHNMGYQYVYTTEGLRYQFKRELQRKGPWTFEQFIALAKMFFTGEDVPAVALLLSGKNLLEAVQCIDFSKHPEVQVSTVTNETFGWVVTQIHTVFGDIQFKREPTLDRLGWSNSGALVDPNRFVHYYRKAESTFDKQVDGEEARRSGSLVFDALAMKGTCAIWIDGENEGLGSDDATAFIMWDKAQAPEASTGEVYYLLVDCDGIKSGQAKAGQMWKKTSGGWEEYTGEVYAGK